MATSFAASVLKFLTIFASLGPKIPKAYELFLALYNLFATEIEDVAGGLEVVELTAEEQRLCEVISQAISAEGTQSAFDFSRLRKFVKWASESGLLDVFFQLFGAAAGA